MSFSDVQGGWAGDRIDIRLMDDVAEEFQEGGAGGASGKTSFQNFV